MGIEPVKIDPSLTINIKNAKLKKYRRVLEITKSMMENFDEIISKIQDETILQENIKKYKKQKELIQNILDFI